MSEYCRRLNLQRVAAAPEPAPAEVPAHTPPTSPATGQTTLSPTELLPAGRTETLELLLEEGGRRDHYPKFTSLEVILTASVKA